jgi:hypothetical protein
MKIYRDPFITFNLAPLVEYQNRALVFGKLSQH